MLENQLRASDRLLIQLPLPSPAVLINKCVIDRYNLNRTDVSTESYGSDARCWWLRVSCQPLVHHQTDAVRHRMRRCTAAAP